MLAKTIRFLSFSAILTALLAVTAAAQDFQQSYSLAPGGSINVGNISGDVVITGYDGSAIMVTGLKQGRDSDQVQVVDHSTANSIDLGVHYPRHCNCDASVQFQIQVPRSISYNFDRIHSISGDVKITGVTGRLDASTISGSVKVTNVTGSVSAKSISGDVDVDISRLDDSGDMNFTSISGDVNVKVPAGLDARIDMSSFSGSVDTNLPIQIEKDRYTTRQHASGQVGSGSRRLHMSTVSGSISLKQI